MKLSNKILGIVFFVLLALWLGKKTILKPATRSFKEVLTSFEAASIDKVTLQKAGAPLISLQKKGDDGWEVSSDNRTLSAREDAITGLIQELSNLKTKLLVSRNTEKWKDYEVDDATAKVIELFSGSEKKASLYVGKLNFNQQMRTAESYIRLAEEAKMFHAKRSPSFMLAYDREAMVFDNFSRGVHPTLIILDKKGNLRHRHEGYTPSENMKAKLKPLMLQLVKE